MKTPKHIAPWAALLLLVVVATWLWHGRVKPVDVALVPRREATPASRNTLSPRTDAQAHFSPADIARMEGARGKAILEEVRAELSAAE